MVHSVAVAGQNVLALQNKTLVRYNGEKSVEKIVEDAGLVAIKISGSHVYGPVQETKQIKVFDVNTLELVATHEFPKRPSAFSATGDELVVADKFGDVFRTKLLSPVSPSKDEDNPQPPVILGHVSMVLDLIAVPDFILSSDRDEHIRVSRFPQSFVIERFLLGHTSFVSHMSMNGDLLFSGGGDTYVLLWNWKTGEQLGKLEIGSPVIGLATCESNVYILPENSTKVVSATLPGLKLLEPLEFNETVTCIAADHVSKAEIVVGLKNRVAGYDELEGAPTEPVSERYLRKTHSAP